MFVFVYIILLCLSIVMLSHVYHCYTIVILILCCKYVCTLIPREGVHKVNKILQILQSGRKMP